MIGKMSDIDLLSIGDASFDVFVLPSESETFCRVDDKECLLCFNYGDKIPVKKLEFSIGGNAANNAVGTRRLGVNSACVLTLGDDEIGDQITAKLVKEGVDVSYIYKSKDTHSNYSIIITVLSERTIFTHKAIEKYRFPDKLPETSWIYLTSIGEDFEEIFEKVSLWVRKNPGIKLAYNPGSRQLRAGVEKSKSVMEASYIIYLNRKEAETFTGINSSHGKEKDLLKSLNQLGPKVPIITDGANGSFVFYEGKFLKVGVLPVYSYEKTGAGDSFGSGCISAFIKGKDIREALLWGTVNSASVIGYTGAQNGLLNEEEMTKWLERAKSCKLEVEEF